MAIHNSYNQAAELPVWLWLTQLVVAAIASLLVLARRWSVPHCGQQCNFVLLENAGDIFLGVAMLILLASAGTLALLWVCRAAGSRQRRSDCWIPIAGIVITVIAAVIAYLISDTALLFA
jgi:hypothetical protein